MAWNASLYQDKHAFVFEFGKGVLELLNAQPTETVLDLGCGTGQLTMQIADMGVRSVVGIDSSATMIAQASANYPVLSDSNFAWRIADATDFHVDTPVDAIFSNATLHWVKDAEASVICMSQALKPGGRLIAEMGGFGNIRTIVDSLEAELHKRSIPFENPWYFPSIGTYTNLLESHRFLVRHAQLFDRPTVLADGSHGMRNWIDQFATAFTRDMSDSLREDVVSCAIERMRPVLWQDDHWVADYVRLRFVAVRV